MAATIELGPWAGGLNLSSNRDLSPFLGENELGEATNVILTPEGFIVPRPGCKGVFSNNPIYSHGSSTVFTLLGKVVLPSGAHVVFLQAYTGTSSIIYAIYNENTFVKYAEITGVRFTHVLMHTGEADHSGIIFFADTLNNSYKTTDLTLATAPTKIPDTNKIPASDGGVIVKNRLFLVKKDTSRFMWSPAIKILDWSLIDDPNTTGSDVAGYELIDPTTAADGITAVQFINNSFYIFKRNKTYLFTYQATPVDDAYLRKISDEFGAISSTLYRGVIVVFNRKGVFRIEETEFIDMQSKLNLRFETSIDNTKLNSTDAFLTDFNNGLLLGYKDLSNKAHYYHMSAYTGGWTKWTYDYTIKDVNTTIASPGSSFLLSQPTNSEVQTLIGTTFDRKAVVWMAWKPRANEGSYHLDGPLIQTGSTREYYIPEVIIKTKASIGGSMLQYKKIYRTYMRFYLSDQIAAPQEWRDAWEDNWVDRWTSFRDGLWSVSINYNDYRFDVDQENDLNFLFYLYPAAAGHPITPTAIPLNDLQNKNTKVFKRAYQLPIPQQRAIEFVFELKRRGSVSLVDLVNSDADKPIKQGYYFMLSRVWFDYQDKAGI